MKAAASTKPKCTGKQSETLTPEEQQRRFAELCEALDTDDGEKIVPPKVRLKKGP